MNALHTPRVGLLYVGRSGGLEAAAGRLLRREGFDVERARSAAEALERCASGTYAVAIVEWNLGDDAMDGLRFAQELRVRIRHIGIVLCTAARRLPGCWRTLIDSCDDYLIVPFDARELLARVSAVTARAARYSARTTDLNWGPLQLDFVRQSVHVDDQEITLSPLQLRLLAHLVRSAGRRVTRAELREHVFRVAQTRHSTSIARQICVLRSKLGPAGSLIVTALGGYGVGI
jgi:two-component system phosphate regulon response regulator PhoB